MERRALIANNQNLEGNNWRPEQDVTLIVNAELKTGNQSLLQGPDFANLRHCGRIKTNLKLFKTNLKEIPGQHLYVRS